MDVSFQRAQQSPASISKGDDTQNGQGGRVIMTNSFDRHSKDWIQSMYVLHDEDDLSEDEFLTDVEPVELLRLLSCDPLDTLELLLRRLLS